MFYSIIFFQPGVLTITHILCALHFRVIADAIGAGKTLISIAIILKGIKAARSNRCFPRKSSATLVVVPPGLIDQWKSEINKFTNAMPNVLCIYDTEALKRYSLKDIIEADAVICPVDMLEAKNYMVTLAKMATGSDKDAKVPKLPNQTGQVEKNGALGVWIPGKDSVYLLYPELSNHLTDIFVHLFLHRLKASSQDPYGGGNNPRSQQRREESAYFTYVYQDYIRYDMFHHHMQNASYTVFLHGIQLIFIGNSEQRSLSPMM